MTNGNIQPVFILPEGSIRDTGKGAQKTNIAAAKAVADTVRTTLGPKGMDKMIVDSAGEVVITNDGVTILKEVDITHPAAKMMVEVAEVQESEVGDGTTSAVILAGELLSNSEGLLDRNIHPTVIAKGFELAAKKSQSILKKISEPVKLTDKSILKNVAITAMTGKNVEYDTKQILADIALRAVNSVMEIKGKKIVIDLDNIKIEKKEGAGSGSSQLISGIVIDKDKVHTSMPSLIKNAKIALLDFGLEVKETEIDTKVQITSPSQLQAFIEQEESMLRNMVESIKKTGANVVFCQKGIDDNAQHYLAKNRILAVRRIKESDMEKLARATAGNVVSNIKGLSKSDLGIAGLVEERKLGDEKMIFVENCRNPKAVSIIVRGGTEHVVTEVERALKDAVGDLSAAISDGACVAGGGSVEVALANHLRKYANSLSGKEQLGVQAFADSLESIPRILAENAGFDPVDKLAELKSQYNKNKKWAGLNVFTGNIENMWSCGVIEPLRIKSQAISSASDAAVMLLRVDDIIIARRTGGPSGEHGMHQSPMM